MWPITDLAYKIIREVIYEVAPQLDTEQLDLLIKEIVKLLHLDD